MIRSRWGARVARRHAHALIDWRADVVRGARIAATALEVDLPKRYRLNPKWVHDHVFLWDVHRQGRLFLVQIEGTPSLAERMKWRRNADGDLERIG